ncbi:hypothetical protein PybrP1_007396 [[Pythium] brassicae (nom. inval.)]|nr:hypothetical protein PybrP1_007396 [[Pythium] brassicae (nom. inval.)]
MLRSTAACRAALAHAAKPRASASIPAAPLRLSAPSRFGGNGNGAPIFLRAQQRHTYATLPTSKQQQEKGRDASKLSLEQLLEENAALRKEVVELQEKVKNKPGKFMAVFSQFGVPFVIWWSTLYVGTGVGLYVAFDTGAIAGADAIKFIMDMGLDRFVDIDRINPTYGNIALAAVVNEFLEPLRFPFALATIPTIKRMFTKKTPAEPTQQ